MPDRLRYRDFILRFGTGLDGEYSVHAESIAGEATGRLILPVSPETGGAFDSEDVGHRLFEALVLGAIRTLFERSVGALGGDDGLRIELRVPDEAPELHRLPWELLWRPGDEAPLALSRRTPLTRRLEVARPVFRPAPSRPLRILAVTSTAGGPGLDLEREWRELEEVLSRVGDVEIERATSAAVGPLRRRLLGETFHVVHFIGHGLAEGPATGDSAHLLFETDLGTTDAVDGRGLAVELADVKDLRLVVLNACDSAGGVAGSLLRAGVPEVVAMRKPISDEAAILWSRAFYERLAQGDPVDAAVAEGRLEIYRQRRDSIEWSVPVHFRRAVTEGSESHAESSPAVPRTSSLVPSKMLSPRRRPSRATVGSLIALLAVLALGLVLLVPWAEPEPASPVLSEVFYDAEGDDEDLEWVELYNPHPVAIDLAGYSLGAGGDDYTVTRVPLSGVIEAGGVFLVGGPLSNAANGAPTFDLEADFSPNLQNSGDAADGVALFDVPHLEITTSTVPVDAVIYGSANPNGLLDVDGEAGEPHVAGASEGASIERRGPEGTWRPASRPSPGRTELGQEPGAVEVSARASARVLASQGRAFILRRPSD